MILAHSTTIFIFIYIMLNNAYKFIITQHKYNYVALNKLKMPIFIAFYALRAILLTDWQAITLI